jgi:PAS domain-containing protein
MMARASFAARKPQVRVSGKQLEGVEERGAPKTASPHDLPQRILDGCPDAILVSDPGGTVQYWNAAAERVFGFLPGRRSAYP